MRGITKIFESKSTEQGLVAAAKGVDGRRHAAYTVGDAFCWDTHVRYRSTARPPAPPFAVAAAVVRAIIITVLLGLLLLGVSQSPAVANWLAGARSDSPQVALVAGHWQSDSGAVV